MRKSIKKPAKFVKGKFNPNIVPLHEEKERESMDENLIKDCCALCTNRNPIRAVLTNNMTLLKNCMESSKLMTTLYDSWSAEIYRNSFYYAVTTNNIRMTHELLEANKKPKHFCRAPRYLIQYLDSGSVSDMAFGVRVRKVQMARGNRQGNNAFLQKNTNPQNLSVHDCLTDILQNPKVETSTIERIMLMDKGLEDSIYGLINQAIISGNRKMAAFLINKIKELTNYGFNNLHYEVLAFDNEDLSDFHRQSVHKKAVGNDGVTPTHCACINPNPKYLEALFNIDPNTNLADNMQRKPIHYAAACESSGPLELLLNHGANANDLDMQRKSPLHYAAMYGRGHNVRILLDKAPNMVKARDRQNTMPFIYAAQGGHIDACKAFIEKGANINLGSGADRMTPLMYAAALNHYELAEFLINNKARVLTKDKFKRSALIMAARNGNAKIVNLLLRKGAQWNEPDSSGNTALHYAAAYGWIDCVEELIKAGANVNANSSWKITPLNIAMLKNHFGLVKYLLSRPDVDVNCKDEQGRTLISLAVELI